MIGTVNFSDGKKIHESAGSERLPKQENVEAENEVVVPRSHCETNTSTVNHHEESPKDSISTLCLIKQEEGPSSLEARNSPDPSGQGDFATRGCRVESVENELQRVDQAIHNRQTQKQEISFMAKTSYGRDKIIAHIPSNRHSRAAAQSIQLFPVHHSPPQWSGTFESGTFGISKSQPLDVTPAYPTEIDVIFGRGEPTRKHPGNVIFREHVNKWLDEYMKGSKTTKSSIIRRVIEDVASSGARYLVPLNATCRLTIFTAGCREARKSEIRSKVSHAFRDGERRILLLQRAKNENLEGVSIGNQQKNDATNTTGRANEQRTHDSATAIGNRPLAAMPCPSHDDSQHDFRGPLLLHSLKPKILMQKNSLRSVHGIGNHETNLISPSQSSPQDFEVERPSNDPPPASTDLLSFANILTSLRRNSRLQRPPQDGMEQPHASMTSAPSDPATASDNEKKQPQQPQQQQQQQQREIQSKKDSTKNSSPIVQSLEKFCRECDIVFGRGAPLRQHPGNIRFRRIVSKYNKKYGDASKHEKTAIIQNVIRELQSEGAKFLMMDDSSGVTEASPDEIRMKVSHRFRDYTKGKSNHLKSKTKENDKKTESAPRVASSALSNNGEVLIEV